MPEEHQIDRPPIPWDRIERLLAIPDQSPPGRQRYHRLRDQRLAQFLRDAARTAATIRHVVAVFANPGKTGRHASSTGDLYAVRVARGDLGTLDDMLAAGGEMLDDLRRRVAAALEETRPTSAAPGSREKILAMACRAGEGMGVFNPQDAPALDPEYRDSDPAAVDELDWIA